MKKSLTPNLGPRRCSELGLSPSLSKHLNIGAKWLEGGPTPKMGIDTINDSINTRGPQKLKVRFH